jgi:signal transduction histidine kinase
MLGRTQSLNRSQIRVTLRLLLIVPFLLQIFAIVGLVGYLSFRNGQKAVHHLVNQLFDRASDQVSDHLDTYTLIPVKLAEINQDAIANGELDLGDLISSGRYFWRQAKSFPYISSIGYVLEDGREIGSTQLPGGQDFVIYEGKGGVVREYEADATGKPGKLLQSYDYNGADSSWYRDTIAQNKLLWGEIEFTELEDITFTESPSQQSLAFNYEKMPDGSVYYVAAGVVIPIYDQTQKPIGVSYVDITLKNLSQYLQSLNISSNGNIWLMERDGELLGSSISSQLIYKEQDEVKRYTAFNYPNATMQAVSKALQRQFQTLQEIRTPQTLSLTINHQPQYVRVMPWRDSHDLDLLVVITIPEADFMAQINANTRTTILLCLIALVLASLSGIYTCRWITRPIEQINQASRALVNRQLERVTASPVVELDSLADSFNAMASQLRESFMTLEQANETLEVRVIERTTELSQALHDLKKTQAQLIQQEKMSSLGQLVAGVAHEINNPISFVAINLKFVQQYAEDLVEFVQLYQRHYPQTHSEITARSQKIELEYLKQDLSKILKSMQVGTDRIQEIVLSLRSFSRLDESAFKPVDLHEGIESTLLILQHRLEANADRPAIQVIKNYGDLPIVECYAGQINQVLMNLLSNAIDALEESNQDRSFEAIEHEPNQIWISTALKDSNTVQIQIQDNGIGVPESLRSRLFDPFFTTKPVGKGTGLGLSISYQIITERHGGKLYCESASGITTFTIEIPTHPISRSNATATPS